MEPVKIKEGIYWVGVQDPGLEIFDIIMKTEHGTSYNAYLIKGSEKTALVETVKVGFFEEYLAGLQKLVNLSDIDYLIVNHTEPDHAGSVEKLLKVIPNLTVVAHPNAAEFLREICNCDFKYQPVGDGSELTLGDKSLLFISALLLHWPDTIYTYVKEDKVLFSCDSFGTHLADERIFNDLIDYDFSEDYRYYFDSIISPFKPRMRKALKKLATFDVDIICPGHGPVLRSNLDYYINLYRQWTAPAHQEDSRPKIVMAYVSVYGYTEMMADNIEKGLAAAGDFDFRRFNLVDVALDEVIPELDNAAGLLIGSPTINKDTLPNIWNLLNSLSPINHGRMIAAAFGAYGWSGEAVPNIEARYRMLRMQVMPGLRIRFKPVPADLQRAVEFGADFGRAVRGETSLLEDYLIHQIVNNPNNPHNFERENYQKVYQNKDIMVYWNPVQCTHDTNCFSTLPTVFNPEARPWVNINGDDPAKIIRTVNSCPSGALKYSLPEGSSVNPELARGFGSIDHV